MSDDSVRPTINLSDPDLSDEQIIDLLANEFDQFCIARHLAGQEQYGTIGFMKNNLFTMIAEEIADATNYMRYLYIKMRLLEGVFEYASGTYYASDNETVSQHEVSHDATSFVGAGGLHELLQRARGLEDPRQRG